MANNSGITSARAQASTNKLVMHRNAYAKYIARPMLDLTKGGQFGYSPVVKEWVSNQAYVRRQLIPILLEAPDFFQMMPNPAKWVQTLRALVELHPRTIEGFNAALTVETNDHPVGGAGEMQDEFVDVKRVRTEPKFTFHEKYGMPIQTFLYNWITYGLMDPETKTAMVGTLGARSGNKGYPENMLANWYSMTMLFIEPDPTHRKVVKAWITTNMFPKGTGDIIGKRDLTTGSELLELNIDFTGISQYNLGTIIMAQKILDSINIQNANPFLREAFVSGYDKNVKAATDAGYEHGSETLKTSADTTVTNFDSYLTS